MNVHPLTPSPHSSSSSSYGSPASSMPPSPPLPSIDEVSTIFVVGFPDDMQEREFQNMFIFSKGFEAASLKWHSKDQQDEHYFNAILNKKQMIGFARFKSRQQAIEAAKEMNGKKVDTERHFVLKAEMAKKNLHIKRNPSIPNLLPSAVPLPEPYISLLPRRESSFYDSFLPLPSDLFGKNDYMDSLFSTRSLDPYGSTFNMFSEYDTVKTKSDQNPPCNTLYVGNLPLMTSEEELRYLFARCEGFRRLCFRQKPQGPMCFVEFEDITCATNAMVRLQGFVLSNSIKGGIRLSFSKNPLFFKPNKAADISFGFKQLGTTLLSS